VEPIPGVGGNMLALSPDGARLALTLRGADGKVREGIAGGVVDFLGG
jgi:hypothetical protein